jgi:putative cell wall-binding protein
VTSTLTRAVLAGLLVASLAGPVHAQPTASGTLSGTVTDSADAPLAGIAVGVFDGDEQVEGTETDGDGAWAISRTPAGEHTIRFTDPTGLHLTAWYDGSPDQDGTDSVLVVPGETTTVDAVLLRGAWLSGRVTDGGGNPIPGATVTVGGRAATTGADGAYGLADLWPGRVTASVSAERHEAASRTFELDEGEDAELDLSLEPRVLLVEVVAGEHRVATAVAGSRHAFPGGADAVVIASAGSFPDALAAAALAAHSDGPLLLVGRRLGPQVTAELRRLGATRATIVGATGAVSATVQAELAREGLAVERIAGDGRFDTAALIARAVGPADSGEVIVVSGADFADAMAAAPLAAADGIPILLTNRDSVPEDTRAALAVLRPDRTFVVGGTAVVSDGVLAELPSATRIAGADRHATSAAVARLLVDRGAPLEEVAVATGREYPDGLAAAPLVARRGGALLLADPDPARGSAVYDFLDRHLDQVGTVVVFGGDGALGPDVRARLARPWEAPQ